jgi:hypothetical protein
MTEKASTTSHAEQVAEAPAKAEETVDAGRRAAMLKMGVYAASVAPAMLVLTSKPSQARPDCDNPAWNLGLSRAGHSGC